MHLNDIADLAQKVAGGHIADGRSERLRAMTTGAPTTELYNRFLFLLAGILRPAHIVETGTDRGRSGVHLAEGSPESKIVSIDIDSACTQQLAALELPNVEAVTGNSLDVVRRFDDQSIDLLFLDSLHEYPHMRRELDAFLPKVRPGAFVLLDDIHLNPGMDRLWSEIGHAKRDISELHFSGFGVFQVPA